MRRNTISSNGVDRSAVSALNNPSGSGDEITLARMGSTEDLRTPLLRYDDRRAVVKPINAPASMDSSFENLWSASATPRVSDSDVQCAGESSAAAAARASRDAPTSGASSPMGRRLSGLSTRFRDSFENLSAAVTKIPEKIPKPRSLNYRQQMTLSPFAKFKRFRRFPFKFLFNFLVTLLCTIRVGMMSTQFNDYANGQHDTFDALFRPQPDFWKSPLYFVNDVIGHFNATVDAYYNYVHRSVQPVSNWHTDKDREYHIEIAAKQYVQRDPFGYGPEDLSTFTQTYHMNSTYRSTPFDNLTDTQLRRLFYRLIRVEVRFKSESIQTHGPFLNEMRYEWVCVSAYDFKSGGGQVQHLVTIYKRLLNRSGGLFLGLDLATLICAVASSLLTIKALYSALI
eukprot:Opistho-2@4086